ncbi:MAG: tRNA uridine-5-carboxymethylaminomethyl(34) synthesis GTPase MnmE [Nitrospiraceae bacterium]|nr:tRNA uridine-5-carboxymethylaminomethyl(34) synthesis GTPase MnmE [Nitrospiraceae bacterium]
MDKFDTIAAISTPPGEGGIGIVRLSGPDAFRISSGIFIPAKGKRGISARAKSRRMLYGLIADPETGIEVDEVLMAVMPAPNTYTREEMVEINCHGGTLPLGKTLELVLRGGARLALPGEFTKRAFLNGRIDLTQAEAVLDLIRAKSDRAESSALAQLKGGLGNRIRQQADRLAGLLAHLEATIDFPEEEIEMTGAADRVEEIRQGLLALSWTFDEGRLLRDGVRTAILGRPNVGKSSLLNALLGAPRAIVTEIPGTTRDVITEYMNLGGHALKIMDTAGIRKGKDRPEVEGVQKSLEALDEADLVLCVLDGSAGLEKEDLEVMERISAGGKRCIYVINKTDLQRAWPASSIFGRPVTPGARVEADETVVPVSALTGHGIEGLKEKIIGSFNPSSGGVAETGPVITSIRHKTALNGAAGALERALEAMRGGMPEEIVSIELRDALHELGAITGEAGTEDILARIFSEFCIGK